MNLQLMTMGDPDRDEFLDLFRKHAVREGGLLHLKERTVDRRIAREQLGVCFLTPGGHRLQVFGHERTVD